MESIPESEYREDDGESSDSSYEIEEENTMVSYRSFASIQDENGSLREICIKQRDHIVALQEKIKLLEAEISKKNKTIDNSSGIPKSPQEKKPPDSTSQRELDLSRNVKFHATVNLALQNIRSSIETAAEKYQTSKSEIETFHSGYRLQKRLWSIEKSKFEHSLEDVQGKLKKSCEQNDILRDQMMRLTETVEQFQEYISQPITEANHQENTKNSDLDDDDEGSSVITQHDQTFSNLKEMIKFVQEERRIVDAQMNIFIALLKGGFQHLLTNVNMNDISNNDDCEAAWKEIDQQLSVLKSSNDFLKDKFLYFKTKYDDSRMELDQAKEKIESLESTIQDLLNDRKDWLSKKQSSCRETDSFREKAKTYKSDNDSQTIIDPKEHFELVAKVEELTAKVENLKIRKMKAEQDCDRLISAVKRLNLKLMREESQYKAFSVHVEKLKSEKDAALRAIIEVKNDARRERSEMEERLRSLDSKSRSTRSLGSMESTMQDIVGTLVRKVKTRKKKKTQEPATARSAETNQRRSSSRKKDRQQPVTFKFDQGIYYASV
eukprot:CAMPEP_0178978098 /NCGR_PEP_ID=MMETSP0789-20121207/24930_1 /TAXON_ID=3005 /ORGANISM="Rhizosolenia setigera, Strain CCMP 1694" /LENGTH=549 /DNA_ID=CAMNT_0020667719 /DNA_START=139 /DNA_END=1789 /DNA_ORIENTATION=+